MSRATGKEFKRLFRAQNLIMISGYYVNLSAQLTHHAELSFVQKISALR
jgi:hypothetical protein